MTASNSVLFLFLLWVSHLIGAATSLSSNYTYPEIGKSAPPPYSPYDRDDMSEGGGPKGLEILVVIFFFVAAAWLLVAAFYALLALIVLRLRSRGQLNMDDADFGRLHLFRSRRFYIPCGGILRRYIVAFGHDQSSRDGNPSSQRNMTRGERRRAIEKLFLGSEEVYNSSKTLKMQEESSEELQRPSTKMNSGEDISSHTPNPQSAPQLKSVPTGDLTELTCSICLEKYELGDRLYKSGVCDHMFHYSCILSWLERRSNTECPCCRQALISESDVMEAVKAARKDSKPKQDRNCLFRRPRSSLDVTNDEENQVDESESTISAPDGIFLSDHGYIGNGNESDAPDEEAPVQTTIQI